jgi:putative tryptophan/tyrosine transport system substrate-binding protein
VKVRRALALALVLAVLLVTALAVDGQQARKVSRGSTPRVGILSPLTSAVAADDVNAFRQGMRDLGYIDEHDITIEARWTDGRRERLPLLAAELVQLKMDVVVTNSDPAIRAVKEATRTIPIVVAIASDLVAAGHAVSLARPGGQVTGFVDMAQDVGAKRVELLKELVPTLTRVGVLWNVGSALKAREFKETEAGARAMGLGVQSLGVRDSEDFEKEFNLAARARIGGIVVLQDPVTTGDAKRIARLAAEARLPTIFGLRDSVDHGGLMAYGPSRSALYRRAAVYVDKILKGAKPGDLAIEQPTTFEFVINLKTAKALGLTIPQSLLIRAPELIQ